MRNFLFIVSFIYWFILAGIVVCEGQTNQKARLSEDAQSYFEKQDYNNAIIKYTELINLETLDQKAFKYRAICYEKNGQIELAIMDLESAYSMNNSDVDVNLQLGRLYGSQNRFGEAIQILSHNESLKKRPGENIYYSWYYQILTGYASIIVEDLKKKSYESRYYTNVNFRHLYGLALDTLGQEQLADIQYSIAYKMVSNSTKAKYNETYELLAKTFPYELHIKILADRLFIDQDYQTGIQLYNKILETDSVNPEVVYKLGYCYYASKNYPKAKRYFTDFLSLSNSNPEVYYCLGHMEYIVNNWIPALAYFKKGMELKIVNPKLYMEAGDCAFKIGTLKESELYYKTAIVKNNEGALTQSELDEISTKLMAVKKQILINAEEFEKPTLNINRPILQTGSRNLSWNKGQKRIVSFSISDASPIQFVKLNGENLNLDTTELNPSFVKELSLSDTKAEFVFSDVYKNADSASFSLQTFDSIYVDLFSPPMNLKREIIPEDPFANSIRVLGKVVTQMPVASVTINGFPYQMDTLNVNPEFELEIPYDELMDSLKIGVFDQDGNTSLFSYRINRKKAIDAKNNQMGKTWFVFIENSDYEFEENLQGPSIDYKKISKALAEYKIDDTILKQNLTKDDFDKFFYDELVPNVQKAKVNSLIIWYAGHGVIKHDKSYWIPYDGDQNKISTLYPVDRLYGPLRIMDIKHLLVITDACQAGASVKLVRSGEELKKCEDKVFKSKSAQILTSSSSGNSNDKSEFAGYFASLLESDPHSCISIEQIASYIKTRFKDKAQEPVFGKIETFDNFGGTFFFIKK